MWDLATLLSTNQSLRELGLGGSYFGDPGLELLCEGLKQPTYWLEVVG